MCEHRYREEKDVYRCVTYTDESQNDETLNLFIMKNLKELCDYLNNNYISISEMNELIEANNFTSSDGTCVAEDETHTLDYAEDCVTITYNKK